MFHKIYSEYRNSIGQFTKGRPLIYVAPLGMAFALHSILWLVGAAVVALLIWN